MTTYFHTMFPLLES